MRRASSIYWRVTPRAHDVTPSRSSRSDHLPNHISKVQLLIGRHILHSLVEFFDDSLLSGGTCFVLVATDKLWRKE